mmetsp:Transcript_23790/g.77355  ORF Transcript_23790/g.77355 Transcript_23790/m.77355 type:complete len:494 (-) Transcript_23790:20-1501(-)
MSGNQRPTAPYILPGKDDPFDLKNDQLALIDNLRGKCVLQGRPIQIARAEAATFLLNNALASQTYRRELAGMAVSSAVVACGEGTDTDKAATASLLQYLSGLDETREYMVMANVVPSLCGLLRERPPTAKCAAAATLRNLAENLASRARMIKDMDWDAVCVAARPPGSRREMDGENHPSAQIRIELAATMRLLTSAEAGNVGTSYAREQLGMADALTPLLELLKDGPLAARVHAAGALGNLSLIEANKQALLDRGAIPLIVEMLKEPQMPLPAKAQAAHCVRHYTSTSVSMAPRAQSAPVRRRPVTHSGWGALQSPSAAATVAPTPLQVHKLEFTPLASFQREALKSLEHRTRHILESGCVPALVALLAGPDGGPMKIAPLGKKKKKKGKKEPPLAPDMQEAQRNAAGCLRRLSSAPAWAHDIATKGGCRLMVPLLTSKTDQTRWHAQAAMWNASRDVQNQGHLQAAGAPKHLQSAAVPRAQSRAQTSLGFNL